MRLENFAKVVIGPMGANCQNEPQRYVSLTEGLYYRKNISTAPTKGRLDQRAIFWLLGDSLSSEAWLFAREGTMLDLE